MIGVDTAVAGEVLRSQQPGMMLSPPAGGGEALDPGDIRGARRLVGLLRVGIDPKAVEGHMRCAALDGRLIVTVAKRAATSFPGAVYRLLATEPGAQFAELLAVLGLQEAVDAGGSRCGICNGDEWLTLRPDQVEAGQVPAAVLRQQSVFYRCGKCHQIFWPGDKYESTMEGLRMEGKEGGVAKDGTQDGAKDGGGGGNGDDDESSSSGGGRGAAAPVAASRVGTVGGVWEAPVTAPVNEPAGGTRYDSERGVWKPPANGGQVLPGDMRIGDEKVATSMWFRER